MSKQIEWRRTTLGEALPIRYGKARTDKAGVVREETPVYGSSGLIAKFDRALTTGPALIIGRKGTVGATHYSAEPCWPIDTVYFAEAGEDKDLRFFKYLLDHLQLGRMDRSTAVPGLSRDDYNASEVAIPDITEQQRIVAEIEKQFTRLDAGVASLKRIQSALKRYRASVLKAACEGHKWSRAKLGDVVSSMKNGIYKPRSAYAETGIACLRMYNIEDGKIVWKNIKRMKLSKSEVQEYQLMAGDLLVNRVNSRELVGKAAPIPDGLEPCVFESKNIRVRLKREIADPKFIGFALAL